MPGRGHRDRGVRPVLESLTKLLGGVAPGWVIVGIAVVSTFLEISKIKISPWSALAKWLGRAFTADLRAELTEMRNEIGCVRAEISVVREEIDADREENKKYQAKQARTRILRFGDECLHHQLHTKEHFDEIMRDIKAYEDYCRDHPKFENNQAVFTIERINEIYQKHLRDDTFLK